MKEALDQYSGVSVAPPTQLSHQEPTATNNKQIGGYDSIKLRYLRSLNIPIPIPKKIDNNETDTSVVSSAPIPIPNAQTLAKRLEEEIEESDDSNRNSDQSDDEITPKRERRKRGNTGPKFVPPHEMLLADSTDPAAMLNHSLPANYRRHRNLGI